MALTTPLSDIVVLEWGQRVAARACGSLLAQAGATVLTFRAYGPDEAFGGFKNVVSNRPDAREIAGRKAHVILTCSDEPGGAWQYPTEPDQIVCDIVVDGVPDRGRLGWTDPLLQAATGLADTTGLPEGPPTICDAPIVEMQSGIYAAAAILAAWRCRTLGGNGQSIRVSLLDCGLSTLSTFLPYAFDGKDPKRSGNKHPMAAPWNSYRARDGRLLLCTATDEQWQRFCALIGKPELTQGRLATLSDRIAARDVVDAVVEQWAGQRSVNECVTALTESGLAAGAILPLGALSDEPNLIHRDSLAIQPGTTGRRYALPRSFLKTRFDLDRDPPTLNDLPPRRPMSAGGVDGTPPRPLDDILVLEIGQYTTAPLAAKQLALLGARVIKIEPLSGDASRTWPPHQGGLGYFFTINNANKSSCALDLRSEAGREAFARLIAKADVLVENLKPGSLDRLGFGDDRLAALNPTLIYCAISGFGHDSAYPGRPAFDAVIQAMSGLMDLTLAGGAPTKLGISAADVSGGIAGLFCILAGLEQRKRTGRGAKIDLAMQDVAVWLTQTAWNGKRDEYSLLECMDGFVAAAASKIALGDLVEWARSASRESTAKACEARGIAATAVRSIGEIAADPSIVGDGVIKLWCSRDGRVWPLLGLPFHLSGVPPVAVSPIGALGEVNSTFDQ